MDGLIDGLLTFSRAGRAEHGAARARPHARWSIWSSTSCATRRPTAWSSARSAPGISGVGRRAADDDGAARPARQCMEIHRAQRRRPRIRFYAETARRPQLDLRDRQRRRIRHGAGHAAVPAVHAPASPGRIRGPRHGTRHRLSASCSGTAARSRPSRRLGEGTTVRFWLPRGRNENWRTRRPVRAGARARRSRRFRFVRHGAHFAARIRWRRAQSPRTCHLPEWPP